MDIGEEVRERGVGKGGLSSEGGDRGRMSGGHVMGFEREFIGGRSMREKIQRGGVFYSQQEQSLNFLDPVQELRSLIQLNIPSIGSRRSGILWFLCGV